MTAAKLGREVGVSESTVVRFVLEFGFEKLGLHRIEARFMQGNERSLGLMRRLGMSFEGYHTDEIFVKGSYRTVGVCALLRDQYFKKLDN